jgi:glutaminyl-tRNA synthetase
LDADIRLYEKLFNTPNPNTVEEGKDFTANLNPNSLELVQGCKLEQTLAEAKPGQRYQFERLGYFCVDPDSRAGRLVFNRTVALKDTWAKIEQRQAK